VSSHYDCSGGTAIMTVFWDLGQAGSFDWGVTSGAKLPEMFAGVWSGSDDASI
jgi:hypothetical protein